MHRLLAFVLAAALVLGGCSAGSAEELDMISGVGQLEFSVESSQEPYEEEYPPSNIEDEKEPDQSSSEESSSSSSQEPPKPVSSPAESSSQPNSSSLSESKPESSSEAEREEEEGEEWQGGSSAVSGEISAVWISYLDLGPMLTGKSKAQFTSNIGKAFDKISDTGFNTVIVQVRPFADALYESDYFPWSYLCTGTEGEDPGYDPLAIMVNQAHSRGLEIEAWLNPYRVRSADYTRELCDDNQATIWLEEDNDSVVKYKGGIYYNPASKEAQELILSGVEEIVENYDVDGIHMDDYFYPDPDKSFDAEAYAEYKGNLSLADWRRQNVDVLVKDIYSTVKRVDSSVRFGISPAGNNDNNYNRQYADVAKWVSHTGYIDYICPQIYWGFDHDVMPYAETVSHWDDMVTSSSVKLIVGIGAYRMGEGGEWNGTSDILARMVKTARKADNYGGIAMYRYDSLYNSSVPKQAARECSNLSEIL